MRRAATSQVKAGSAVISPRPPLSTSPGGTGGATRNQRPSGPQMEPSGAQEAESGASAPHNTVWRQLQARAKPLLSPKLGSRDPEDKKDRGGGIFKKMKRRELAVLDRVISSSQPDLLFSAAPCGGASGREEPPSRGSAGPQEPAEAHVLQSHHKSSSLGSACLENLAEPPSGAAKEAVSSHRSMRSIRVM